MHQSLDEAGVECVYMNYAPNPVPFVTLPEIAFAPASMENILETPLDLYRLADNRDESGQLVIELQQKLMAESYDREYRWRAPPLREHYALKLDVARRVLEIPQMTSNGLTLQAQIKTSTSRVDIEECPDIDGTL